MAWINFDAYGAADRQIIVNSEQSYENGISTTGRFDSAFARNTCANWGWFGSSNIWNLNTWYFVVSTWDGYVARHYVNGNIDYVFDLSDGDLVATCNCHAKIGARGCSVGSGAALFSGYIDDVKIYERALSAEEIMKIYNNTKNKYQ